MKALALIFLLQASVAGSRELASAYMVPASANNYGKNGTDWHTDLTLVNPHNFALPIVLQFLPSGRDNSAGVPTVTFWLEANQTMNLWDVLGPHYFDARGKTGALLVAADTETEGFTCSEHSCDFVVFSRTYTVGPLPGEFGQALPGFPVNWGLDGTVLAYLPQVSHDQYFRTNLGVASLTSQWVEVGVDLQAPDGELLARNSVWIPPFGHSQWAMGRTVTGGTLVLYIKNGPQGSMVFPYASVVNQRTGDPVYIEAHLTPVGVSMQGVNAFSRALGRWQGPPRLPLAKDFSAANDSAGR